MKRKPPEKVSNRKVRPALNPEARENQLIALAVDLVEQRLLDGTASSQETTHFLKLGSMKNQLEMEKLREENTALQTICPHEFESGYCKYCGVRENG